MLQSCSRATSFPLSGLLWLALIAAVCCAVAGSPECLAQDALPAALERSAVPSPEQRENLYRQLRQQAQVIEAQSAVVKTVAKLIGPTVVQVIAETAHPAASPQIGHGTRVEEAGSGVLVRWKDKDYVLTNRHVIRDATRGTISITLSDGRLIHPDKLWDDAKTDVAVLAVSSTDLVCAPLGNSDAMETGDFVLAVGSPFGLNHSVTYGIISAKGRRALKLGEGDSEIKFQDFLQTDAAINPGNSGGPLINLRGEVVGINTAIATGSGKNEGAGFSIPINMFMAVAKQLIDHGTVTRAFMGVHLNTLGPAMAVELGLPRPAGALISDVIPNSPAATAKLEAGDVILEFNNTRVEDDSHLIYLVSMTEVGKEVPLVVFRDRRTIALKIEVGDDAAKVAAPESSRR